MRANYVNTKAGDKVRFMGTEIFWFTNMIEDANNLLKVGEIYTVASTSIASSWTGVTLTETGDKKYNLFWFDKV